MSGLFPDDSDARKTYPVYSGLLAYFPAALAAIAHHSYVNNAKHNPGEPLHWNRAKSADEADALLRHLMEGDYVGMAWRALALLQKHLEAEGAPLAPGAVTPAHTVEFEADPVLQELLARADEDAPVEHLKAGEAHEHDRYAYERATAAQHDTGE